jgi:hypothetical protein
VRRAVGGIVRRAFARYGFEVVRAGSHAPDPAQLTIPRGRAEPFTVEEYEVLPRGGYDIVPRTYYSAIPHLDELPGDIWKRRSALGGVTFDVDGAMTLVESELAPYIAEFDPPLDGPRPAGEFFLHNLNYESVDAELLYAMVRSRKPRRVLELGSGYTSLLIGDACRRNAEEGTASDHLAYDPYPRADIFGSVPPLPTDLKAVSATEVPLDAFRELQEGDILFVDTTHTVKLGSDVNYVILDVLPALSSGVIIHFHDIFLPWEYPRVWFEEMQHYWAEQYLLQAFLAFNNAFDVLVPAQAIARKHPERLAAVISSFRPGVSPGAIWLKRR